MRSTGSIGIRSKIGYEGPDPLTKRFPQHFEPSVRHLSRLVAGYAAQRPERDLIDIAVKIR